MGLSLTLGLSLTSATLNKGAGVVGPYPAPTGWRWEYIAEGTNVLAENNNSFVELVRAA